MRAVFLNNLTEAKLLESGGGKRDWDFVIPVGPDARYNAEQKKWPLKLIGDFVSRESHQAAREHADGAIGDVMSGINRYFSDAPSPLLHQLGTFFRFDLHIVLGQILFTRKLIEEVSKICP